MATDKTQAAVHRSTGPFFDKLPHDIILSIIEDITDIKDLVSLMHTSKFFYGFVSYDQIWKDYYTERSLPERQKLGIEFDQWRGSWKKSILDIDEALSVDCSVIYSDLLFTPYQNSQIDYNKIFGSIIKEQQSLSCMKPLDMTKNIPPDCYYKGRIPRIEESSFTMASFNKDWCDYPFILKDTKNKDTRWPKWTIPYLLNRFPKVKFRQECVDWPLSFYCDYAKHNQDEKPLYLFDCKSTAMKELNNEFKGPPYTQVDYLKVFGDCRPDHSWMTLGPNRSGSGFHKDPNSSCAWNTVFQGAKLWVMLPPDMTPPGVHTDATESEVTAPVDVAEWVVSGFYNDSVKLSDGAYNKKGFSCIIGMTFPGECMFVPAQWWHTVINFEDTVALTANFVPYARLGTVLDFFKNKPTQISGFHPKEFREFLEKFVKTHKDHIEDKHLNTFNKYLEASELGDTDEDVGELDCEKIDLPVYELFVELLKDHGYEKELTDSLKKVHALERERDGPKVSKNWEKLTKNSNGFSFGFSEDDLE